VTKKEFISKYLRKHTETGKKFFPDDFLTLSSFNTIKLSNNSIFIGKEMFGKIELLTTEGETAFLAEDIYQAKYIVYSKKYSVEDIKIPIDNDEIKAAVVKYEKYLDGLLADIKEEIKKHSVDIKQLHSISNEIFVKLNLVRY